MRVPNSNREIITCSIIEADADDDADVLHIGKLRRSASSSASASIIEHVIISLLLLGTRTQFSQFKRSVKRKMLRTKHEVWLDLVMIFSYTYLNVNKLFVLCLLIKL